jgi:hypothetical protein
MNTRSTPQGSRSAGITKLVLVLMLFALLAIPSGAMAAQPVHVVRGHGIYNLTPPSPIDQISINATVDTNGVASGMVVWLANYLAPPAQPAPDWVGWIWKIEVNSLVVAGNVATIGGTVVADNRFPANIGCQVGFIVTDNGNGAANPDVLELVDNPPCVYGGPNSHSGGNFTVK